MPSFSRRQLVVLVLLTLVWGFNWPAVRISLTEIAPWTLRAAGMSFAGLVLVGIALARGVPLAVPRAQWPRLVVAGFLSIAAFNVLLAFAQLAAPFPGNASWAPPRAMTAVIRPVSTGSAFWRRR